MVKSITGYILDARSLEMLGGWLVQEHEEIYEEWLHLYFPEIELDTWLDHHHPDVFTEWVSLLK